MTKLTEERIKELLDQYGYPEYFGQFCDLCRAIEAELQPDPVISRLLTEWKTGMKNGEEVCCELFRHFHSNPSNEQPDFCDTHCTWRDHHPDCERAEPVARVGAATGLGENKLVWLSHTFEIDDSLVGANLYTAPPNQTAETKWPAGYWRECHVKSEATVSSLRKQITDQTAEIERLRKTVRQLGTNAAEAAKAYRNHVAALDAEVAQWKCNSRENKLIAEKAGEREATLEAALREIVKSKPENLETLPQYIIRIRDVIVAKALGDKIAVVDETVLALAQENAALRAELSEVTESNKAVEKALEDVPYKGSYADGVEYLKAELERVGKAFGVEVSEWRKLCLETQAELAALDARFQQTHNWLCDRNEELAALKAGDMVMVPREPTQEMLDAAYAVDSMYTKRSWSAMLAAAPGVQAGEKDNAVGKPTPD